MTKSLNQAFIKAYTKEKSLETSRAAAAMNSQAANAESLMMRFDTSSCDIPGPHSPPPTAQRSDMLAASVHPKTASARAAVAAAHMPLAAEPESFDAQPEEHLRQSIASQMMRAGAWEDQQIDAFIGGFPMISPFHQPHLSGPRSPRNEAAGNNPGMPSAVGQQPNRTEAQRSEPVRVDPPAVVAPAEHTAASVNQSVGASAKATSHPTQSSAASIPPTQFFAAQGSVDMDAPTAASPLVPPAAPALVESLTREAVRTERTSEERIRERASNGEIFRLDRPSYVAPRSVMNDGPLSDSGDDSSIIGSLSHSKVNIDFAAEVPNSQPSPANPAVKEVEEHLRQARVRIFNPVWEVDNFQWPEVCLELLALRAESMEKVARNLVSACQEGLQVLAVTSPQSGEGRTTVACCLAKLVGSRGVKVAIVDGDIENPTLSYQTNLDLEQDWKTAIFNQLPLEEVAVHSIDDQVTLVPLVNPIRQDEMAADDNRIAYMLQELSESFDLVIVDMGHMNSTRSLVTSMGEQGIISAVVAVVDHRCSTPQQIEACLRRIRRSGVSSIGLVENFAA